MRAPVSRQTLATTLATTSLGSSDWGAGPRGVLERARLLDRDRRLARHAREDQLVAVGERARRAVHDVEQALDPAVPDGDDHLGDDPLGRRGVGDLLADPRVLRVVVRPERPPGAEADALGCLADGDPGLRGRAELH